MQAWVNGQLLDAPEAPVISVLDHGLVVGDGVFETVAVDRGEPFALTRHVDRLVRSAMGLGIGMPDVAAIREGVAATLDGQDLPFGLIRITVTSGIGPLGSARGNAGQTLSVVTTPWAKPPSVSQIVTVPWARNEKGALTGLKTTSYAENAIMIEYAKARGATEAVMANTQDQLCEGTGSNVFYAIGDQLITPTLAAGPLPGITRALVLQWCAGEMDVVERDAPLEVLFDADEVMLIGTSRDVQAVSRINDHEVGAPGPLTRAVQEIWASEVVKSRDP
jgi:branched-chain amino acid aminotransferase